MGRILGIDYGNKRVGIAWTDPLRIIPQAVDTVDTDKSLMFIKSLFEQNDIDEIVIGYPLDLNGNPTDATRNVVFYIQALAKRFPHITIHKQDETYSSRDAVETMIMSGMKKKDRRKKENIDMISAVIILKRFMGID